MALPLRWPQSPIDLVAYFRQRETDFTLGAVPVRLLRADPHRVAILFGSVDGAGVVTVSTRQDVTAGRGFPVGSVTGYFPLVHSLYGGLVQVEWFGVSSVAATITVLELCLDEPGPCVVAT